MKKILLLLIPVFILFACEEEDTEAEQLKKDIAKIEKYLADNNLVAQSTASGLHYIIHEEGTGDNPAYEAFVDVIYTGMLLNGTVFDSGRNTFVLAELVLAWQEGIPLIKKGGSITLYVPSKLGYGDTKSGIIPANSVLIFDIELLNVLY